MAGGLGKRMESDLPKVLHKILDKPMIVHVIEESIKLCPKKILIVVGIYYEIIKETISKYIQQDIPIKYIYQPQSLGTGHAIQCCVDELKLDQQTTTLILSGDVPFLKYDTMSNIINTNTVKIGITELENSFGYGRIILNDSNFEKIVEEKDCSAEEEKIKLVNCGIYAFNTAILCKYLHHLSNNNSQKEYYLTDIIEIIKINENKKIELCVIEKEKHYQIMGINTKNQLLELERLVNPI